MQVTFGRYIQFSAGKCPTKTLNLFIPKKMDQKYFLSKSEDRISANSTNCCSVILFFYLGFLSQTFTNHRTAVEGEGISLIPHYHFHQLCRHLDISRAIAAESSPLHIVSRWTRQAYQDKFYVARDVYSVLTIVNSVSQYVFLYCEV